MSEAPTIYPGADEALHAAIVAAAQDGKGDDLASGILAMDCTAALLFLRGQLGEGHPIPDEQQRRAVEDAMLARAKAVQFGRLAAAKLCGPDTPEDTVASLAGSIAVCVMAHISMPLIARACGANPVAASGMVSMGAQAILKDLIPTQGEPR